MTIPHHLSLDAVSPGMEFGPYELGPIERPDIARYAGASGDFNPIHIDEGYARRTGAPTVFAMGMLPAGYLAHAVSDWIGGPQNLRRFKVRFTTRVWPGDHIVCTGRVESLEGSIVTLKLEARRRGPGPEGANLPEEEVALVGEADADLGATSDSLPSA